MIRVNLLGIKKEVARASAVSIEGAKLTVVFGILLAVAVGVLVVDSMRISSQKAKLDELMAEALAEKARLEAVKLEYDQNEQRRKLLQGRIDIIDGLRKKRTGPVNLLKTLVNTVELSEHLWMTDFSSVDNRVSMNGMADSVNTVADFITNLKCSGRFKSVEIQQTFQEDQFKDFPTFVFSITAEQAPLAAEQAPLAPASASDTPGMQ